MAATRAKPPAIGIRRLDVAGCRPSRWLRTARHGSPGGRRRSRAGAARRTRRTVLSRRRRRVRPSPAAGGSRRASAGPAGRWPSSWRVNAIVACGVPQLLDVGQHLGVSTDRHHREPVGPAEPTGGADHRDRRDDAGTTDQAERRGAGVPDEPATDRAPELQDVADLGHVGEELRDLARRAAARRGTPPAGRRRPRRGSRTAGRCSRRAHAAGSGSAVPGACRCRSSTSMRSRTVSGVGSSLVMMRPVVHVVSTGTTSSIGVCGSASGSGLLTGRPGSAARATGRRGRGSRCVPRTRAGPRRAARGGRSTWPTSRSTGAAPAAGPGRRARRGSGCPPYSQTTQALPSVTSERGRLVV